MVGEGSISEGAWRADSFGLRLEQWRSGEKASLVVYAQHAAMVVFFLYPRQNRSSGRVERCGMTAGVEAV